MAFGLSQWLQHRMFSSLVFNQMWEDFDVDREALAESPADTLVSITSGGCSTLNCILEGPRQVYSVDLNPAQTRLLELKICAVQQLDYGDFWEFFGQGKSDRITDLYYTHLRHSLSPAGSQYWDTRINIFKKGLYESGRFGSALKRLRQYLGLVCGNRVLEQFFDCTDVGTQRNYYERNIANRWWNPVFRGIASTPYCLVPFGASLRQAKGLNRSQQPGFPQHLKMQIHHVLTTIPIKKNYFWQQIFLGRYMDTEHLPLYLLNTNFMKLKSGISRIQLYTSTITDFLSRMGEGSISRFNLSDVMDWMSVREIIALWRQVFRTATPDAVIIWRSVIPTFSLPPGLMGKLHFLEEKARHLLTKERTGAYARFFICTLGEDS